jgi:hypothetical protein
MRQQQEQLTCGHKAFLHSPPVYVCKYLAGRQVPRTNFPGTSKTRILCLIKFSVILTSFEIFKQKLFTPFFVVVNSRIRNCLRKTREDNTKSKLDVSMCVCNLALIPLFGKQKMRYLFQKQLLNPTRSALK